MSTLFDSHAFRDDGRMLPQHQAALTLLQGRLANPGIDACRWLDLACGRGQILTGLREGLSPVARKKLSYEGYEIVLDHARETAKLAESLELRSSHVQIGALVDLAKHYGTGERFDFITLTNTTHEVRPRDLSLILLESLARLDSAGCLFVYDMESLNPPELGAIPWRTAEVERLLRVLLATLGCVDYQPVVGHWRHKTCDAWNVQIQRDHLGVEDAAFDENRAAALDATEATIVDLLERKRRECHAALDELALYGAETPEEEAGRLRLLYEFWAINRALGAIE